MSLIREPLLHAHIALALAVIEEEEEEEARECMLVGSFFLGFVGACTVWVVGDRVSAQLVVMSAKYRHVCFIFLDDKILFNIPI